jgi:hypothetical protein
MTVVLLDGSRIECGPADQVFTFNKRGGKTMTFCVSRLEAMHAAGQGEWEDWDVPIREDDARMIARDRGIERHRLDTMPESRIDVPGLGVREQDGGLVMVDGNHRYLARHRRGLVSFTVHCCVGGWEAALIDLAATAQLLEEKA